jgi:hypothetical protein
MSKFCIGFKIKKVRGKDALGHTGRVVGLSTYPVGSNVHDGWTLKPWVAHFPIDIQVMMDKDWPNAAGEMQPRMRIAFSQEDLWEPVVPDGMEGISWEESLFIPDGKGGLSYNRELIEEPAYAEVSDR